MPLTSNISRLKVKGWKIICQPNNQKKAGMIIIKSEKVNFRAKNLLDRQGNNIVIKVSVHYEHEAILNRYAPKNRPEKHVMQKLTNGEIDKSTITIRDFNNPLSTTDRSTRQ